MKTLNMLVIALASILAASCGPKDVIPSSPTHPANPEAPTGQMAHATQPDAGAEPAETGGDDKTAIAAAEQAAYEAARPVFEKYCSNCHSSAGKKSSAKKLDHFNMDTYPFGGHHATVIGETIREVLGVTGEEPSMPKDQPGAVKGSDLDLIVAWSKAFDASHKAGLHHHDADDHEHHHEGH